MNNFDKEKTRIEFLKNNPQYSEKRIKKQRIKHVKKGHCARCSILLNSIYAIGHNGMMCGECLKQINER